VIHEQARGLEGGGEVGHAMAQRLALRERSRRAGRALFPAACHRIPPSSPDAGSLGRSRHELVGLVRLELLQRIGFGRGARYLPRSWWLTMMSDVIEWAMALV